MILSLEACDVSRYRQLREEGNLPTQAWAQLKRDYITQFRQRTPSGDAEQSWKSASGKAFEDIVRTYAVEYGDTRANCLQLQQRSYEQLRKS